MKRLFFCILLACMMTLSVLADDFTATDIITEDPIVIEHESIPTMFSENGVEALADVRSVYNVYPQSVSNGQTYLKAVLENYPHQDYLFARVGEYQYILWVGGEYEVSGTSVNVTGAKRFHFTYHYYSSSSSRYSTVSISNDVSDRLGYDTDSYVNVYSSLQGYAALRGEGNNNAISWFMLAAVGLCLLLLPLQSYFCRRAAPR